MLRSPLFWDLEKDATLLLLNRNYLQGTSDHALERVKTWPALVGLEPTSETINLPELENVEHIILMDADRTFKSKEYKDRFMKMAIYLKSNFQDYAQGLGFATAFLLLTMEEAQAASILTHLNTHEKYIPGYWKHEAVAFATDAYVFRELLQKFHPDIATHLHKHGLDPSNYCQRWFVGLCVQVLPFENLFLYFEKFLQGGHQFLLKFGLSFMKTFHNKFLSTNSTEALFGILRLDPKFVAYDPDLLNKLINDSDTFDLSDMDIPALRKKVYDSILKDRLERARLALQKKEDEEEEIEDCQICKDDFPEVYCKVCKLKICENCHKKPPKDSAHLNSHFTRELDEDEDDEDDEEEEKEDKEADKLAEGISKLKVEEKEK